MNTRIENLLNINQSDLEHPRRQPLLLQKGERDRSWGEGRKYADTMKRYPHYLINLARQFRKRATPAEAALWERLRNKKLGGYKFVRQFHIERYIADFCCREQRLVVEVEGGIHEMKSQKEYDRTRFEELELAGFRVLRFKNEEIFENVDVVLHKILAELKRPSPPNPSPVSGEGRSKSG